MINGVIKKLQDTTAVTDSVPSTRILPLVQYQGDELPAILVDLEGVRTAETKSATSRADSNDVSVIVIALTAKEAYTIASACRNALDGFGGTSDGVEIAEARFLNWSTEEVEGGRYFVLSSAYVVTVFRDGATAIVQGTAPTGAVTVQELDGTPSVQASTLKVPNGSLSVSGNVATLDYTSNVATVQVGAATSSTATTNIGSTETTLTLDTKTDDTGGVFTVTGNQLRTPDATNVISVHCRFRATTNHELPHVKLYNTTTLLAEGASYITGQHGDTHTTVSINAIESGPLRLLLKAFNEADGNDEIICESATIIVTSVS